MKCSESQMAELEYERQREAYEREQIATAQSEMALEALQQEYAK